MPWSAPVDPVSGAVITVSYAVTNMLDPIRWLRLMTGNADPPGSAYVPLSGSVSAVAWSKVTSDAIAPGAVSDDKLATAKVSRAGDTMTSDLTVSRALLGAPTQGVLLLGQTAGVVYIHHDGGTIHVMGRPVHLSGALAVDGGITAHGDMQTFRQVDPGKGYLILGNNAANYIGFDGTDVVANGAKIWTSANDGPASGLQAQLAATADSATNAANAAQLGGRGPGGLPNQVPYNGGAGFLCQGLNAEFLGGADRAYYESLSGGGGTGTPIPPGLICLWNTGTPPIGWAIETTFQGRFPLSANATWPLGTNAGAGTHTHATNIAHGHADSIGFGGTVGGSTGATVEVNVITPGTSASASGHGHGFSGSKSGGVTALGSSPVTSDPTAHMPPFYAIHYIRKS